ncbi:hypothetical protein Tco_0031803 [Tanacetum coccineum]
MKRSSIHDFIINNTSKVVQPTPYPQPPPTLSPLPSPPLTNIYCGMKQPSTPQPTSFHGTTMVLQLPPHQTPSSPTTNLYSEMQQPPTLQPANFHGWCRQTLTPEPTDFHENTKETDDELTDKEVKQMEVDDQAIQTILMGLLEDIYAVVDSYGESTESYYHRFSKLMNDFKRNKHFSEKIARNLKFLNNLQPEWKRHITIEEVNELRAERLAKTHDPLALMANYQSPYNYPVFHPDHQSQITYMKHPSPNNNYILQSSFNQNYMQQLMKNPEDISDPTTAMNMQIAQPGMNMGQDRQMQMVGGCSECSSNSGVQNVRNQNGLIIVLRIANQNENHNGNGNVIAARAEGDLDEIEEVNENCIYMANLQQASTSGTQTDKAPVYDSDGSAEVHHSKNCYDNDIFNMFTQEEQYTELLEPISEPHQV